MTATDISRVSDFLGRLTERSGRVALFDRGKEISSQALLDRMAAWESDLHGRGAKTGQVCAFVGEFNLDSIALLLALMRLRMIAMPLSISAIPELDKLMSIAGAAWLVRLVPDSPPSVEPVSSVSQNALIDQFGTMARPGLIVFTSGSSGKPKGILHDFDRVLEKFVKRRVGWRTVLFLTIDHFGGINTLLGCLANEGVGICVPDRSVDTVCDAIQKARADLLPTTPTFLNLLVAMESWRHYDLSSLRVISYGAEPMAQATLDRLSAILPQVKLKQTYGLSELGVLHSDSPTDKSLWVRVGGDGFETRVVDGVLEVRSVSNMVGYLNAPNPIDPDGWMSTGDIVDERDGLLRFRGRVSEIINVGGQKVFPTEVENVLLKAPNVTDALVYGVKHPLLGQAVCAKVALVAAEPSEMASSRLRDFCRAELAKFKVPMRIEFVSAAGLGSERGKKVRQAG